jgi:voltage-gated potassium channel Kch
MWKLLTALIIIAGFGRFGLVIGRLLLANNYKVTIIDSNPCQRGNS